MERIKNPSYSKETFLYAFSRMLERASYYGIQSILMFALMSDDFRLTETKAYILVGSFAGSIILTQIIGALLGDLVIGNKKAIVIGGILQGIGALSFCIPFDTIYLAGGVLIVLGNGLYVPNMISNFGRLHLSKRKLLDSAFSLLHLAINVGSFLGVLCIGYLSERYGWTIGFMLSGILMLIAVTAILFSKETFLTDKIRSNQPTIKRRIVYISIGLIAVALFWAIYGIATIQIIDVQHALTRNSMLGIPKTMWSSLDSTMLIPLSLIATIVWTYFYSSQFFKIMMSFIFGTIAFVILLFVPENPAEQYTFVFLFAMLLLAISETYITPIIYSVLTKYTRPKYLAIAISLSNIPTVLVTLLTGLFMYGLYENPSLAIITATIAAGILSIGLVIFYLLNKHHEKL